jgi:hypothetical protein
MPENCNGLELIDKTKEFCKINCRWVKKAVGRHLSPVDMPKKKDKRKKALQDPKAICLILERAQIDYIKSQSLKRSKEEGVCIEVNELIREAIRKAFPCPALCDMFGD